MLSVTLKPLLALESKVLRNIPSVWKTIKEIICIQNEFILYTYARHTFYAKQFC